MTSRNLTVAHVMIPLYINIEYNNAFVYLCCNILLDFFFVVVGIPDEALG